MASSRPSKPYYPRPELAARYAGQTLARPFGGSTAPGIFLAAPRRTGKSTFLFRDLKPELEKRAHVIYVDLWANQDISPSELIATAIAQSLLETQGKILKAAKDVGLSKVEIKGVAFEFDLAAKGKGPTLTAMLEELLKSTGGKPIVLIVDEAQHVVTVDDKLSVMFALKSARDTLNMEAYNFALVMSGSDRDKLLRLVHAKDAPFLNGHIEELDYLDDGFVRYAMGELAKFNPTLKIDNDRMCKVFDRYGRQPEPFIKDVSIASAPFAGSPLAFNDLMEAAAEDFEAQLDAQCQNQYREMTKLQRAIISHMLEVGSSGLFTNETLKKYSTATGKKIQAGQARAGVEKLRSMEPPVIWKSARGDYAFEDVYYKRWYKKHKAAGTWPPKLP